MEDIQSALREHSEVADALVFRSAQPPAECVAVVALSGYCSAPDIREFLWQRRNGDGDPVTVVVVPAISRGNGADATRREVERLMATGDALVCRFERPRTETERTLVTSWQQVLGRKLIGVDDNFMDLGGDSLGAMVLLDLIAEKFGVEIPLDRFFDALSARELASVIDEMNSIEYSPPIGQ
jgi:acyl carrier protein